MPITEDDVKNAMGNWLKAKNYSNVQVRLGTEQGFDVEGIDPANHRRLIIECKGEALTGDQHQRSWENSTKAVFTAITWKARPATAQHLVGVAFPDTHEYHNRIDVLRDFFGRETIRVFWVTANGDVSHW